MLRFMALTIEADEHGGKLVVCEDELAVGVMAVDEHAHGLERDVEGHSLRFPIGAEGQLRNGRTPMGSRALSYPPANGHSTMCGLVLNIGGVEPRHDSRPRMGLMVLDEESDRGLCWFNSRTRTRKAMAGRCGNGGSRMAGDLRQDRQGPELSILADL